MKNFFVPAIGAAAFVIGGIITRQKAFEAVDVLEKAIKNSPIK